MKLTHLLWLILPGIPAISSAAIALDSTHSKSVQPYSLHLGLDLPLAAGILAMNVHSGALLKNERKEPLDLQALHAGDIPGFDRWAIGFNSPTLSALSSGLAWSQFLIPVAVNAWDTYRGQQPWYGALTDAVILEEALMLSNSLSSYAKSFPLHSTPVTYDPRVSESEKRTPQNVSSFFSNHTATAFTTAVFTGYTFQLRHPGSPLVPWIWGTGLTMATGVGALRIMAGKHFPSDVVAGAAVGALSGYFMPRMHLRIGALRKGTPTDEGGSHALPAKRTIDVKLGMTFPGGGTTPTPTVNVDF
ncbi:MAG: phosphoesterase PA-phosphatase [Fibrobacteres bacterium]|nr:phosphoesterase PA-phosphatase [Fibrobacterota bacterium]